MQLGVHHNRRATARTVKAILKDGTPKWVRFPQDYRSFAREEFEREKKVSDDLVREYRMENQDDLTDEKTRKVNIMHMRTFLRRLRENGVQCVTSYAGLLDTVGFFAVIPGYGQLGHQYITWMQVPYACEWDVIRLDRHHLPNGFAYRGWRSILAELIKREVVTEQWVNDLFGYPMGAASKLYRWNLWRYRNRRGRQQKGRIAA